MTEPKPKKGTEVEESADAVTKITSVEPPAAPKIARAWKPKGEEFSLDQEFAQLVVDLGESIQGAVQFHLEDEERDGVAGHTLVAEVLPLPG